MPNDVLSDEEVGLTSELSDSDVGLESETPKITLSPYEELRMKGLGGGIAATSGPPHPEEVITIPESLTEPPIRIPRIQAKSTAGKILAAPVNVGAGVVEAIGSPLGLATLPIAGTEIGAPVVKGIFGGLAAKSAGEAAGRASVTRDPGDIAEAALQTALPLAITLPGSLPPREPPIQGPLPEGRVLTLPPGAPAPRITPPPPIERVSPRAAATAAKSMSREATAAYEPAPAPRATVPAGPSDPRVIEARRNDANTINKVLKLFPEMRSNREAAREILKQAFPSTPSPEAPPAEPGAITEPPGPPPTTAAPSITTPLPTEPGAPVIPSLGDVHKGTPELPKTPKGGTPNERIRIQMPDGTVIPGLFNGYWEFPGTPMDGQPSLATVSEGGLWSHGFRLPPGAKILDPIPSFKEWKQGKTEPTPEKITAAAYTTPEGKVETGANHPEILQRLGITGFETPESRNTPQFGFVTDKGRFITREEAGPVSKASGQNLKDFEPGEPVHSDEVASPVQPEKPLGETGPTVRGRATTADVLGKVSSRLDQAAAEARARIAASRGRTTFGSGPLHELPNIRDYAIIGAAKIAKGATDFVRWSGEMIKDFGEGIKPHLDNIFKRAQDAFDEHTSVVARVNRVLYEAGLPRRSIAAAGKKAVGKSIEAGVEAGRALAEAEAAPGLAAIQAQLTDSIPKAQALREYFRGQEIGGKAGRRAATEELKLADKWLEADARRIRDSLIAFANTSLPVSERGRFLKAITDATKRPPLLGGDPEAMYRRAAAVAARIEDRATDVRKASVTTEIKDAVTKALQSPSVDIGYKKQILDTIKRITFVKPTEATSDALKATRDFLTRAEAAGEDVTMPKEVLDELEVLGKVPAKELPEHVLEAIRDKVNLLDQLGRLKVKARKQAWEIEKNGKLKQLSEESTNPVQERPEFRQQPGDPRPLSTKIRNWANRQLNMGTLLDKALLPIDALLDLLGDAKGAYRGWLFRNVRNPLDLDFNSAQVMRDIKTAPLESIIKRFNLGERESERIGVYAAAMQEGGVERLVEMGVKPETIDGILKTISSGEMEAYQAMREAMDSTLPDVQKLMHELYNIDVKPVPDYFPMPRDWNLFEPEPKPLGEPKYGKEMDFDELSGWKQMLGDFTVPKTTKSERGFTLARQKGAVTPIKLNAFDVFFQHMNDVAYLIKTQRDLKMIGEMARGDLFKQKYGNVGQNIVTSWLDTVARQGRIGGFRRIPMLDELRRRTSAGVIGFRLASQFVHLSNIPLAVWRAGGPLWWKAGLGESLTERGQNFLRNNFAETFARGGGEPALVEASQSDLSVFGKRLVPKAVIRAGFAIARQIDRYNAQATTLGIYLRLLAEKGLDPRNYDKMPVDKEAQAQALVLSRRAVASPLPKDVSASLARGAITGGNISLGRTIFQFQNIFQDQWSNIRHDLARAGIREENPKLAATAFIALTAMLLSEMGIRETSKEIISSVTGYKPKKEPSPQERIALEAARRIPFGGQISSQLLYGETGVPVIDSIVDTEKAIKTAATAKKEATQTKALVRAAAGAAQLGGVPGASQVGELIQKAQ